MRLADFILVIAASALISFGIVELKTRQPELPEGSLPPLIEDWSSEQLEDQTFEYKESLEVIKNEMARRERLKAYQSGASVSLPATQSGD